MILVFLPRPPSSPSQRCKVYTQKGVMPATPPLSSHTLAQDSQATDALTSDSMPLSTYYTSEFCLYWNLHIPVGYLWYFNFLTFKLLIIFYLDYLYLSICSSSFSPIKSYFGKFKTIATLSRNEYSYPHQLYHMHISSLFQYNLLILCFFKCNFSVLTHAKASQ